MRILLSALVLTVVISSCSTVKKTKRSAQIEINSATKMAVAKI